MFNLKDANGEGSNKVAIKAGLFVPAKLLSVEFAKDKDGNVTSDLSFNFKGTEEGNTGDFSWRVFASTFDPNGQYNTDADKFQSGVERCINQIKHVVTAFVAKEVADQIGGASWTDFAKKVIAVMKPEVLDVPCELKVIYTNKDYPTFPAFPNFIKTERTADRNWQASTKVNPNTGQPYERFEKLQTPTSNPAAGGAAPSAVADPFAQTGPTKTDEADPFASNDEIDPFASVQ